MTDASYPAYTLGDGAVVPQVGFGTYPLTGDDGIAAMVSAIEAGYRYLDSAVNYENEREVGEAVRRCGLPREEVRVATKVPGRHHEKALAIRSIEESLERMRLDQLDMVLIHWPNPSRDLYLSAWEGLVKARERGLTRSIGVSNFTEAHLTKIIEATGVTPAVNQIELHPAFPQEQMRAVNERLGILTQAWSPLGKREAPYEDAVVAGPAEAHGVSPAQVLLRWHLQLGTMPLPKSATPERQRSNLDVHGFELTEDEMAGIETLARADGRLFDGDPDTHEEM